MQRCASDIKKTPILASSTKAGRPLSQCNSNSHVKSGKARAKVPQGMWASSFVDPNSQTKQFKIAPQSSFTVAQRNSFCQTIPKSLNTAQRAESSNGSATKYREVAGAKYKRNPYQKKANS